MLGRGQFRSVGVADGHRLRQQGTPKTPPAAANRQPPANTSAINQPPPQKKGFCKQQLWPLFHYILPMSPSSAGRYNAELWQAYVKANKVGGGVTHMYCLRA